MTDMERRKFEDSFKEAFDGAEVSPSEKIWTNIELDLEKAEGGKMRRRLLFYKLLAAASVAFAMCVAGIGYYAVNKSTNTSAGGLASSASSVENNKANDLQSNTEISDPSISATPNESTLLQKENLRSEKNGSNPGIDQTSVTNNRSSIKANGFSANGSFNNPATGQAGVIISESPGNDPAVNSVSTEYSFERSANRSLPAFYSAKDPELVFPYTKPDPGALLLAKLAEEELKYAKEDKKEKEHNSERLWTSVGFAAGGFSSVNPSVSPTSANQMLALSNSSVPDKQSKASGVAYSYGVNIGAKLSKRWVIQGGVNYLTQSSDYTATNVVGDNNFQALKAESINVLDKANLADGSASSRLAPTFPYSVNNNVQFFSVPVQAGYLVVNKKFGFQLNAGLSTDLFLQNTITPEGVSLDKTTQGRGEDSPYRSVNFSGLMGTELSYRFGHRYRVALNPGLRYPINSVYKSDVGIQSTPLTFDVGLRFRYIFH